MNPATNDTTLVIRVWTEWGDSLIRGRIININSGDEWAGRGADQLLQAVENLLRQLEQTADTETTQSGPTELAESAVTNSADPCAQST